jgi:hypothetical protein
MGPGHQQQRNNPPCKSNKAQGKLLWEKLDQGQHDKKNLGKMHIRKEASAKTGMQTWDKEQTPETAATKQKGIHQDLQENHWTTDCKVNYQIYCWVAKDQGLDIVEGSAPSETEKPTSNISVR